VTTRRHSGESDELGPAPSRPSLPPGYGTESATSPAGERLPWSQVSEWLQAARNYWVSTTRPDGRPHVKPVWGLWLDAVFMFSTHPDTVTARNLAANPAAAVHLESGDRVVIVEGLAERLEDSPSRARFAKTYPRKYDWQVDPDDPGTPVYAVRPSRVLSWDEAAMGETIARWSFTRR
jgi:general stress protein 26